VLRVDGCWLGGMGVCWVHSPYCPLPLVSTSLPPSRPARTPFQTRLVLARSSTSQPLRPCPSLFVVVRARPRLCRCRSGLVVHVRDWSLSSVPVPACVVDVRAWLSTSGPGPHRLCPSPPVSSSSFGPGRPCLGLFVVVCACPRLCCRRSSLVVHVWACSLSSVPVPTCVVVVWTWSSTSGPVCCRLCPSPPVCPRPGLFVVIRACSSTSGPGPCRLCPSPPVSSTSQPGHPCTSLFVVVRSWSSCACVLDPAYATSVLVRVVLASLCVLDSTQPVPQSWSSSAWPVRICLYALVCAHSGSSWLPRARPVAISRVRPRSWAFLVSAVPQVTQVMFWRPWSWSCVWVHLSRSFGRATPLPGSEL
jgi:hypothetical protein